MDYKSIGAMTELTLAWHFTNGKLRDGQPIPPDGEWLRYEGKCFMCERGLHASKKIIDALQYAPGSTIHRVVCANIQDEQSDKFVCRSRFIMWRLESNELLRTFARSAALSVIHLWDAPAIVRQYLETGDEKIRVAAWDAAGNAAWAAARAAASAAGAAARAAAGAAARDAARDAEWDKLNTELETIVLSARGNPDDQYLLSKVPMP